MKINHSYDTAAGVLYVYKNNNREGYVFEDSDGIIYRRANDNDEFLGLTVLFFEDWAYRVDDLEMLIREKFGPDWSFAVTEMIERIRDIGLEVCDGK